MGLPSRQSETTVAPNMYCLIICGFTSASPYFGGGSGDARRGFCDEALGHEGSSRPSEDRSAPALSLSPGRASARRFIGDQPRDWIQICFGVLLKICLDLAWLARLERRTRPKPSGSVAEVPRPGLRSVI